MIKKEKELAKAIMRGDCEISISDGLCSALSTIKNPSEVIWMPVLAALGTILVSLSGYMIGLLIAGAIGFPILLTLGGGVGTIVFGVLGARGTICAISLSYHANTVDILTKLRDDYILDKDNNKLIHK